MDPHLSSTATRKLQNILQIFLEKQSNLHYVVNIHNISILDNDNFYISAVWLYHFILFCQFN